jgi:hypothetical protein
MAFNGSYYLKVGNYEIPLRFMKLDSYQTSPDQRQDLDSYRDADGILHRTVLPHTATKVEFETPPLLVRDFRTLIDGIRNNYLSELARDCTLTYYDDETDSYKSGHFYLPGTMTYKVYNKQIYNSFRIAFIEY